MAGLRPDKPRTLFKMEILQMSVAELSFQLHEFADETQDVSFQPYPSGTFVSDEVDVGVTLSDDGLHAEIAEPPPGNPILTRRSDDNVPGESMRQLLIDSIAQRRVMLQRVTDALIANLPEFPRPGDGIRMSELARICDVHITTVSRTLDNKTCATPSGRFALRDFITGLM